MPTLEDCTIHTYVLASLLAIIVVLFLWDTIRNFLQIIRALLGPYFIPQEDVSLIKKYGPWALVTGSTDGIGKQYARELARRGLNVVLVSRSHEKLQATAKEIETDFEVKTRTIAADFSTGPKAIEIVSQELGDLPIGILVNNVGINYSYPTYLGEVPEKDLWDIININVGAATMMTRLIINDMKKRGRGAIINVSSGSELQPLPLMNVYAATKAYLKSFTTALRYEYADYGITVQHLSPLFVCTKINQFSDKLMNSSFMVPDAKSYAKYAVFMLGKSDQTTGYWSHGLQYFLITLAPLWLRTIVGKKLNKGFRNEYLQKLKKTTQENDLAIITEKEKEKS